MDAPPLTAPPEGWRETRDALHRLADKVIAPARVAIDGGFELRWVPGGFGTPRLGERQIRTDGADLVVDERRQAIRPLRDAAAFAGLDASALPDEPLAVDAAAAAWLSDFYAFVLAVLEDFRGESGGDDPVLWPE